MTALGAVILNRHVPGHEAAGSAGLAGVVSVAPLGLALEHSAAAFGAAAGHPLHQGLCVLAVREAGTGQEFAEAAHLDDHLSAAQE